MRFRHFALSFFLLLFCVQDSAFAKTPSSKDFLKWLKSQAESASISADDLSIPDYEQWFDSTFGKGAGRYFASSYPEVVSGLAKSLPVQLRQREYKVVTTVELDAGVPAQVAYRLVQSMRTPVEIYVAYVPAAKPDEPDDLISFFVFEKGAFRSLGKLIVVSESGKAVIHLVSHDSQLQLPLLVKKEVPVYPSLARSARVAGTLNIQVRIAVDGSVQDIAVTNGHPLLQTHTLETVAKWKYMPALLNGKPIEVLLMIPINFGMVS